MRPTFNAERLTIARMRRGMTKKHLADRAGLNVRNITEYEQGRQSPTVESLSMLSVALGFPVDFFCDDGLEMLPQAALSFRSRRSTSAALKNQALATATFAQRFGEWLIENFNVPNLDIPEELSEHSPEDAAAMLRAYWGNQYSPLKNVLHLLEAKGVFVFSFGLDSDEVDAFSFWKSGRPFILLSQNKTSERRRFNVAHELGHLVLHRDLDFSDNCAVSKKMEQEADDFAAAFLMPGVSIQAEQVRFPTIGKIFELKKKWNVSAMAMLRRLNSLGMISPWTYKKLCIELSKRGLRSAEEDSAPFESSEVLRQVAECLARTGKSFRSVAVELNFPPDELNELVFGLATQGSRRPTLRLVK